MSITPQTLLRFTVGAAITAVVLFLMWYFSSIVIYILVSAVLAIMGRPLVARISRGRIGRWRVPRWCGALVTLLVIWIVFAVMCGLFVPLVTNKLYQLAHLDFSTVLTSVEEPLQRIQDYLTHFFSLPETQVSFKDTLISFLQSLINFDTINTAFSSVVSLAVSSVIAFFSIFVHHVLFPAGRRTFLCDGNGTFPGSIPTERDACPQFGYSASVPLLPGGFWPRASC